MQFHILLGGIYCLISCSSHIPVALVVGSPDAALSCLRLAAEVGIVVDLLLAGAVVALLCADSTQ